MVKATFDETTPSDYREIWVTAVTQDEDKFTEQVKGVVKQFEGSATGVELTRMEDTGEIALLCVVPEELAEEFKADIDELEF